MKRNFIRCLLLAIVFFLPFPVHSQDELRQILAEQELGPEESEHIPGSCVRAEKESGYKDYPPLENENGAALYKKGDLAANENEAGILNWFTNPPGLKESPAKISEPSIAANPIGQLIIDTAYYVYPSTIYEGSEIKVYFDIFNTYYYTTSDSTYVDVYISKDGDTDISDDIYAGYVYVDNISPQTYYYTDALYFDMPNFFGCDYYVNLVFVLDGIVYITSDIFWVNCKPTHHSHGGHSHGGCFISTAKND